MSEKKLTIAVISDLHCHPKQGKTEDNKTILFSDSLRTPEIDHPIENLGNIISETEITADVVLCPGDFTNLSNQQGFLSGWNYVQEISRKLNADEVIATIGNHDVDSRHNKSNYYLDIPKGIKQDFPIHSKHKEKIKEFWADGYCFIENDTQQILVINSTHYHTHKEGEAGPTIRGKVNEAQIEDIKKHLASNNHNDRIKIAMFHHHPIQHSRFKLGDEDFVENGSELMDVLGEYKFDLIIHGHKHDPWLRYHTTSSGFELPILSSGSFSATNQISYIGKFNYFHILEISKSPSHNANATVATWVYKPGIGWALERKDQDGFFSHTGFGYKGNIDEMIDKIKSMFTEANNNILGWDQILEQIPDLKFLTPDKMEKLQTELSELKITVNPIIGMKPTHAYYYGG